MSFRSFQRRSFGNFRARKADQKYEAAADEARQLADGIQAHLDNTGGLLEEIDVWGDYATRALMDNNASTGDDFSTMVVDIQAAAETLQARLQKAVQLVKAHQRWCKSRPDADKAFNASKEGSRFSMGDVLWNEGKEAGALASTIRKLSMELRRLYNNQEYSGAVAALQELKQADSKDKREADESFEDVAVLALNFANVSSKLDVLSEELYERSLEQPPSKSAFRRRML